MKYLNDLVSSYWKRFNSEYMNELREHTFQSKNGDGSKIAVVAVLIGERFN